MTRVFQPHSIINSIRALFFALSALATPAMAGDTQPDRTQWFREARFGMFIHWGVYAVPAGEWNGETIKGIGEWIMRYRKIPVEKYTSFAPDFTAAKYDPQQWAALASRAGMKYVVITSKHHDGFALYDSAVSDWNVMTSGAKRDLLAPLAKAVRGRGMKFGLYFSQSQDWTHPGGATSGDIGKVWDPAQKGDYDEYLKTIALPQVREIIDRYDPAIIWWDTPMQMTPERVAPFAALMARHPHIVNNNRLGDGFKGDTMTPEQYIPPRGFPGKMFEVCMTMNDTWGYKTNDRNWKSAQRLIRMLSDIASKGGNLLLNIGPRADGSIPQESIDRLDAIARWMDVNSEAIYGTSATVFGAELGKPVKGKTGYGKEVLVSSSDDWRCTAKPASAGSGQAGKIYLHLFKWPASGKFELPDLRSKVTNAYLLADRKELKVEQTAGRVSLSLPAVAPDKIASVICLELADKIRDRCYTTNDTLIVMLGGAAIGGSREFEVSDGLAKIAKLPSWATKNSPYQKDKNHHRII